MQFGERTLFDDLSLMIGPRDRIGLTGPNGAGKTTLLKIIAGIGEADRGTVARAGFVTVGYLPQDGVIASGLTLYGEAETAFEDILLVRAELDEARERLARLDPASDEHAETLEISGELQHKLEDLDADRMTSKVERVLMGLGFTVADFTRPTGEFSGGWQMRIALAKLLLREPSLLLLDEPTNHLDIGSLRWLEEYLLRYNGAVVLVSHDRAFLDTITARTVHITQGRVERYAGNYSFFEREERARRGQRAQAAKNQQREIRKTQEFIDRFRYKATKARQVQSRIKALEKIDIIEEEDGGEEIRFQFPTPGRSGARVLELRGVRKSYGGSPVFSSLDLVVERGERIAVVGPNGAGKSTLARIVAGVEPFDAGERSVGHNVLISYFGQHQAEELDLGQEALDVVGSIAPPELRPRLRTILGAFLFHGDDVFKKVGVLSGGEKSRLALARMLLRPANLLVMDEPTNHLDMRSKEVLGRALAEYEGTILIVSHDRSFLDPLVGKVLEVTHDRVRSFPGNVSEYLARTEASGGPASPRPERGKPQSDRERRRAEAERRAAGNKRLGPLKRRLEACVAEIERLEKRKGDLEAAMAAPEYFADGEAARRIAHEYRETAGAIEKAYAAWQALSDEISAAEGGLGGNPPGGLPAG